MGTVLTYALCLHLKRLRRYGVRVLEVEGVGLWGSSEVLDFTSVSGCGSFSSLSASENNADAKLSWALTLVAGRTVYLCELEP